MSSNGGLGSYIKTEPDDQALDQSHFMMAQHQFDASQNPFGGQYGGQNHDSIDPSALSMSNGNFGNMSYPFGSQQNLSSSFNLGNSGIADDELMDSLDMNNFGGQQNNQANHSSMNHFNDQAHSSGISMGTHTQMNNNVFSNTPEGGPIQSPFVNNNFNYDQFRPNFAQHMSPRLTGTQYDNGYMGAKRPSLPGPDRRSSDQRSPMTPKTPAIGTLHLGTPDSVGSYPTQIRSGSLQNRHQKTLSNQWDSTPGSLHSFVDSPISSPGHPSHHQGISEILKSGKHASLPTNVDTNATQAPTQNLESQEAKRRRRRASHNLVERRRRDNINERIQDLSHLVPLHRLEDDKVRKALQNNSPLSPVTGASSISPPNSHTNAATSLLAGSSGRRAASTAGNITIGLPMEDKEKGPNKGDILNGAVGWTRDLMWSLYAKIQQEQELESLITSLGGSWPFEISEDEKRMRTELLEAMENNDPNSFAYSRGPGSGLRVPKHTTHAGDPLNSDTMSPQSLAELSPPFNSGGSGANSGGQGQSQYWNTAGHAGISFKEEDEYQMEI